MYQPSLRQLELFACLVEQGSISKVAAHMHISQPSVSIQLKKLAQLLDVELYQTQGKRILITTQGQAVYKTAREMQKSLERLQMNLDDLKGLKAGKLKICVVSTAQYFMPLVLGPFCKRYPNIDVSLTVNNREQVIERLLKGRDDFYLFSHCPEDLDIEKTPLLDNALMVVAPINHELTRQPSISLQRLQHYDFIMREKGSGTRRSIEDFCKESGIQLNARMTIESNEAIKHAVAAGLGLAILSRHTIEYGNLSGLVKLDVENFPINSQWYLVHNRNQTLSPIAQVFFEFVQEQGQEILKRHLTK